MSTAVTIITGAGGGVGAAVARRLAARGHRLTLVGRTRQTLAATRATLADAERHLIIEADVADRGTADRVVRGTVDAFGTIDVLVNNAGRVKAVPIADTTPDLLDDLLGVNTIGPALLMAAAWPVMVAGMGGRIVNVSSMAVFDPFPGLSVYAASKCALDGLTRAAHNEGAEVGIRAVSVAPGAVETPMLRSLVSTDELPTDLTLDPDVVAAVIEACAVGERDAESGQVIALASP